MVNKLFVASTTSETKCHQEKPIGRLRQSEVFFPLAIVAHHVVPPGICPGLVQMMLSIVPSSFTIKDAGRQQYLRRLFGF